MNNQLSEDKLKDLQQEISDLKKEKKAVILGHYYQNIEVQEISDYKGDSLGLSKIAQQVEEAEMIVFAGVYFMAETAKILNPEKKVVIPDKNAGCPLANYCNPALIKKYKSKYPDVPVVLYVNTTAESKALADITCTSSNSTTIVKKLDAPRVLFGPDYNLSQYVQEQLPNVEIIPLPQEGRCYVHKKFKPKIIKSLHEKYPKAKILAHPECDVEVQHMADHIGSTSGMLKYVEKTDYKKYIIATEKGLVDRMRADHPNKEFIHAKQSGICKDMKKITLEKIKNALRNEEYEVIIPKDIQNKAKEAIERMLELS
ncbi:MAG: quinolinate synthase NadA [Asgard group archaeon]|nr:quinolinate synthase NadA [Asgard group archaeon]